jgi:hypothetical protein
VHIQYGFPDAVALDMANAPSRVRVELSDGWSIIFGTSNQPKDGELTTKLAFITSQWEEALRNYTHPWQIRLEGQPWRIGEGGEICAKAFPALGTWSDDRMMADASLCARKPPTFIKTSRQVETRALLKHGRDANWPLKVTAASAIDEFTSLSLIYEIDWEGIQ